MHVAGVDIADRWPSLYTATTLKSYEVPELSDATTYCVAVTRDGFTRVYVECEDLFEYTSYPERWASITAAQDTRADAVPHVAVTCFGSSCP